MKRALDSEFAPSDASIAQARAAGVGCWAGYFAGPNIANGWSMSDFHRVQAGGLATLAYCSGYADPLAMRSQSLNWGVPICLDCESGIRPDGAWVEGWLSTARAGLYGNGSVHYDSHGVRTAAFHVFSGYYGYDPQDTWPNWDVPPAVPCGWQYQGSNKQFGMTVDLSWFDDELVALLGGSKVFPIQMRRAVIASWWLLLYGVTVPDEATLANWAGTLKDDGSNWDAIFAQLGATPTAVAWRAKLQGAGGGSGPDDDSAYLKTADLKAAIGGLP